MDDECVRHECAVALLLIDVINDMEFDGGEVLVKAALPAAGNIARLKQEAKKWKVPCPVCKRQLWPVAIGFQASGDALCPG
jgi:hypothetical protein